MKKEIPAIIGILLILAVMWWISGNIERKSQEQTESFTSSTPHTKMPDISPTPLVTNTHSPSPSPTDAQPRFPVAEFKERITKKKFGTYITPNNSPVQPERFSGYHTGVDIEYEDVATEVPVYAIADGTIHTSTTTSGYGGVIIINHLQSEHKFTHSLYGHLRPSSLPSIGKKVSAGEVVGVLGSSNSIETDGERKHLHFSLSYTPSLLGYVQTEQELYQNWLDPEKLY